MKKTAALTLSLSLAGAILAARDGTVRSLPGEMEYEGATNQGPTLSATAIAGEIAAGASM
jgi:hypothetical protein